MAPHHSGSDLSSLGVVPLMDGGRKEDTNKQKEKVVTFIGTCLWQVPQMMFQAPKECTALQNPAGCTAPVFRQSGLFSGLHTESFNIVLASIQSNTIGVLLFGTSLLPEPSTLLQFPHSNASLMKICITLGKLCCPSAELSLWIELSHFLHL